MKKLIGITLALTVVVFSALSANAFSWKFWRSKADIKDSTVNTVVKNDGEFEIIPTLNTESNAKNVVWVGTFQLVWNDLIDEIIKRPVEFAGAKSVMADNLNEKSFTTNELSENAYYKKWGLASPELKKEIEKGIKDKFNEKSDILDSFDFSPAYGKYFLYAMLKKDFEYVEKFTKLPDAEFGKSGEKVKYFGIDSESSYALKRTIGVLFYNNSNDFAVTLTSKQGDIIYLYRTDDEKTLDKLYSDMLKKSRIYMGEKYFDSADKFKAPMIDFKSERNFPELCNKPIKYTDYIISQAIETVQFKMDEAGVKLKSEAAMMVGLTAAAPSPTPPRYFNFTDRYVIFIKENGKEPYFAMKVEDAKKYKSKDIRWQK